MYEALLTGEVNGELVFDPSPLAALTTSVEGLADVSVVTDFNITPLKIQCTVAAFGEAASILAGLANDTSATINAQAEFVGAFTTGFSGG